MIRYCIISYRRYEKLNLVGKMFIWFLFAFYVCLGAAVVIITPHRIGQFFYDMAQKVSHRKLGWLILGSVMVLVSFPPFIGFTTMVTLCGFAYDMNGLAIAVFVSIFGSAIVFAVLRFLFANRLRHWSASNERWQALEAVIMSKGLPLIILIRLSPFPPWVYSNALFASIESVSIWQFMVASACLFPKMLLHVFIGARLAALSDDEQRRQMDTQTKILNAVLVAAGIIIGIVAGWVVYNQMQKHIRHAEGLPPEVDELAVEAIEDVGDEGAPLLTDFSSESLNETSGVDVEQRLVFPSSGSSQQESLAP
ncbi:Golgi apparatus membrane protein TVP38 [Neolentinus lepideus HHB14362 ss-1]|uniref:Golgi apparatus membrane protein TVP38 n=1 Tax=Neolentinus lepideus HHB14362 ss-1 TaxID=1314782 RepID=A0A165RYZ9_9AGAM|nr:Golgi apparatus membrane protein TVP38 [Neolentinus lepideus HHB14362 ss-1]